uniref:Uncharacterized protein n=1 Tax=Meloidogyne enterolobii TaxID=390850 RepID=A0A6V7VPQ7_MELEN|nr:unnamed protein product [Meloidogyne enterolobii]
MLFCLLHPMDHNTGPLARKSSMLCVLLLVSIAALLVLAVPGQAKVEEVGVANHILDQDEDEVEIKEGMEAKTSLTYAKYKERYPTVCEFSITKEYIELRYKGGDGCTVELVTKKKNMLKFTAGVKINGNCLKGCNEHAHFNDGFSNLLPFAYSRNNEELKKLNNGPQFSKGEACTDKACVNGCLDETFLEVSWSKCRDGVYAHTHLIGEYETGMDQFKEGENKKEFTFDLEIYDNNSFKMDFDGKPKTFGDQKISCILTKTDAIVKPKTWKIVKNEDLKGKHLLVFHLLPPKATGMYKEGGFKQLKDNPTCDLFIRFKRPDYELLFVPDQTSTTVTTTTTTTETTPATNKQSSTAEINEGDTTPTAKVQEVKDTEKGSNVGIVIIVIIVVLVFGIGGGFLVWFYVFKKEPKQPEEEAEEDKKEPIEKFWKHHKDNPEDMPSPKEQYVLGVFDKMSRQDTVTYKRVLFELYLPELIEKDIATIGNFEEWREKNGFVLTDLERDDEFCEKIDKAIKDRKEKEAANKLFNAAKK